MSAFMFMKESFNPLQDIPYVLFLRTRIFRISLRADSFPFPFSPVADLIDWPQSTIVCALSCWAIVITVSPDCRSPGRITPIVPSKWDSI